jgi:type IV pilus assembly protein PilF
MKHAMRTKRRFTTGSFLFALIPAISLGLAGCAGQNTRKVQETGQDSGTQSVDIKNRPEAATDLHKRADIRMQLAANYFQDGKFEVALNELKQALTLDPNFAEAHGVLALVYMQLGEKVLAEQSFHRALQLKPDDSDINNNYGWFLCQNGRERASIAYFENALKNPLYQQPALPLQNAGVCKLRMGDKKSAEEYFRRSFDLDPSGYVAAFNLAAIYLERNELERARFYVGQVNRGPGTSAASVWLALRIERKLVHRPEEASLASQLRRQFPTSRETQLLIRAAYDE